MTWNNMIWWIFKSFCWMKETRPKRLYIHIILFWLYEILQKEKLIYSGIICQYCLGSGMGGDVSMQMSMKEHFEVTLFYILILMIIIHVDTHVKASYYTLLVTFYYKYVIIQLSWFKVKDGLEMRDEIVYKFREIIF